MGAYHRKVMRRERELAIRRRSQGRRLSVTRAQSRREKSYSQGGVPLSSVSLERGVVNEKRNPKVMYLYSKKVVGPRLGLLGLSLFGGGPYRQPPRLIYIRTTISVNRH